MYDYWWFSRFWATYSYSASYVPNRFVSVMADKKVSLNVIREFVGHSEDSKEIEKIYLHVMQKGKYKIEKAMLDLAEIITWVS